MNANVSWVFLLAILNVYSYEFQLVQINPIKESIIIIKAINLIILIIGLFLVFFDKFNGFLRYLIKSWNSLSLCFFIWISLIIHHNNPLEFPLLCHKDFLEIRHNLS